MLSFFKKQVEVPNGENVHGIYTFDGRPMRHLREGDRLTLTLIAGEHTMESIYTGSTGTGNTALTYKGKKVGFLKNGDAADELVAARDALGPLTLHAVVEGYSPYGWPFVTLTFDRNWVIEHGKG